MKVAGWLYALPLLLLAAGYLLFRAGLRGVQIDDHPVCRKCRFDLFGLPIEQPNCPECGSRLADPRAVRLGNRRRRRVPLALGAVLLLVFAMFTALFVFNVTVKQATVSKPTWLLVLEAHSGGASTADVLRELKKRSLGSWQASWLTARALAVQGDPNQAWLHEWGELLEDLHLRQLVSQPEWERYLAQALDFKVQARPKVRFGDPVPIKISNSSRAARRSRVYLYIEHLSPEFDGKPNTPRSGYSRSGSGLDTGGGSSTQQIEPNEAAKLGLTPGTHTYRLVLPVSFYDGYQPSATLLMKKDFVVTGSFTVLPADQPTVLPVHNDSLRPAVEQAISVSNIEAEYSRWSPEGPHMNATVSTTKQFAPVSIAYRIVFRADGREWSPGQMLISWQANKGHSWSTGSGPAVGFAADKVDVILRPDPVAAARTIDVTDYWDGELVFKDVKVTWKNRPAATQPAATQPAATQPTGTP